MDYIIWAFALGIFLVFLKYVVKPKVKGAIGETIISINLSGLPKDKYILMNDVMLSVEGKTTQIDHILLSVYGIFVIETKNYKGWIYGGEFADQWTQNIYGHKNKFRNPLKQNYGHMMALMNLLELPKTSFIPVVVFSDQATLKTKTKQPVIYMNRIKTFVLGYHDVVFSESQLREFESIIKTGKMESTVSNRIQHVKGIKNNLQEEKQKVNSNVCPKCGGALVNRKGKYGMFLGCSNFPNCKFTKNI